MPSIPFIVPSWACFPPDLSTLNQGHVAPACDSLSMSQEVVSLKRDEGSVNWPPNLHSIPGRTPENCTEKFGLRLQVVCSGRQSIMFQKIYSLC